MDQRLLRWGVHISWVGRTVIYIYEASHGWYGKDDDPMCRALFSALHIFNLFGFPSSL